MTSGLHHQVREAWLAQVQEDILMPGQPILDAHHHLWDRPEGRYRAEELLADLEAGHDVRASLYVQCRTGYRAEGPEELRPVGEIETIRDWSRDMPSHCMGLVGFADLQLGRDVAPVLEVLERTSSGRLVGIRNTTAWHADPAIRSNPNPPPDGLLRSASFISGAREVARFGLALDVWAYQTQLDDVAAIARKVPDLTVVVDHCGGPLGVGAYQRTDPGVFAQWRDALAKVAALPNTRIKIGGFGLGVMGYTYSAAPLPPRSDQLAQDWAPWIGTCLDLFGTSRAMFESNFPVDKGQFSYVALWNAFKRIAEPLSQSERDDLFWRTAVQTYDFGAALFHHEIGRRHS